MLLYEGNSKIRFSRFDINWDVINFSNTITQITKVQEYKQMNRQYRLCQFQNTNLKHLMVPRNTKISSLKTQMKKIGICETLNKPDLCFDLWNISTDKRKMFLIG